jgi:GTP cyclohydrolase I
MASIIADAENFGGKIVKKISDKEAKQAIVTLFEYIGENPEREGLKDTPDRMIRMFREIFRGYDETQKPKITTFLNGVDGFTTTGLVIDRGKYYSLCEHHARTFFGEYCFAYIPNPKGKILGISKVGRVVDYCAARLQIQERLGQDIVEMLSDALGAENPPYGMAIIMRGRHMCKESRGSRKEGEMITSYITGVFKEDEKARLELYNLIRNER